MLIINSNPSYIPIISPHLFSNSFPEDIVLLEDVSSDSRIYQYYEVKMVYNFDKEKLMFYKVNNGTASRESFMEVKTTSILKVCS